MPAAAVTGRSLRGNVDRNIEGLNVDAVDRVVPYVGTWIEIHGHGQSAPSGHVVPYVGTWIEITMSTVPNKDASRSFPTWERG